MINVSAEFLALMEQRTDFRCNADISFTDGSVLNLDKSAFTLANNTITEAAGSAYFPLGVAVSRTIQIELLNDLERADVIEAENERLRDYFGMKKENP